MLSLLARPNGQLDNDRCDMDDICTIVGLGPLRLRGSALRLCGVLQGGA